MSALTPSPSGFRMSRLEYGEAAVSLQPSTFDTTAPGVVLRAYEGLQYVRHYRNSTEATRARR
jgi:hypothetical protein